MVIDPSALVAILQDEPERGEFNESIKAASQRRLSTASFVELSIVIEARQGAEGIRDLDLFLATAGIELVAFDATQARLAVRASAASARVGTRRVSTSGIAFPMPWPGHSMSPCCSRGMTFHSPM